MSLFYTPFLVLCACLTTTSFAATTGPVSLNFGTKFFGSDGLWSAAQIRVGNPEQYLWVYPSTVNSDNWVVGPKGCDASVECLTKRGGLFNANASSSYYPLGRFELGSDRLGLRKDYGDYGLDTIALSDKISAPAQMLSTITDNQVWLGQLGLNVQQPQFSDRIDRLSLIASLVRNTSVISSHSYGYTAGAYYSGKGVPGSLVLGGVDTTRFKPNNAQFSLSTGYIPKVAVTAITVSSSQGQGALPMPPNWMSNPMTLMQPGQAAQFTIDSSTPFLWMPAAVCDTFATALNLTYNKDLQLYMYANTTNSTSGPQTLKNWGLTFTFSLSNSVDGSSRQIEIPISYDAFNLQLSFGFPGYTGNSSGAAMSYFPLKRANNTDQFTIGRAFLQETYLTVDYERNSFSVAPALFPDVNVILPSLQEISRPSGSTWPGPQTDGLSTGVKAGIAVGVILVLVIAGVVAYFYIRRRKRLQQRASQQPSRRWWQFGKSRKEPQMSILPVSELVADRRQPKELLVDSSNTRFELPGPAPVEMPAGDVPQEYFRANRAPDGSIVRTLNTSDGLGPGLTNQNSIRKDYNIRTTVTERSASPAPPYSPGEVGRNTSNINATENPFESGQSPTLGSNTSSSLPISPIGIYSQGSHSDASPVSTELRSSPTTSSNGINSATHGSNPSSASPAPTDMISRAVSHRARFSEELVDSQQQSRSPEMQQRILGHKFSWER